MKAFESYLKNSIFLIQSYDGKMPLAEWLKKYFSRYRKFGSTDRKQIAELCYSYYRLGGLFKNISLEEKICRGVFLCSAAPNAFLQWFNPEWNEHIARNTDEKLVLLGYSPEVLSELFPWNAQLSGGIDLMEYSRSFLRQPDLFIRLRPGYESGVKQKLDKNGIFFEEIGTNCLALKSGTKLDAILELDKECVIQDCNSQKVGEFFPVGAVKEIVPKVWDCCAGSGGKSLLAYDLFPAMDLTVSDNRSTILVNLKKRFATAGIFQYSSFEANLSTPVAPLPSTGAPLSFDFILADVPCSGSGVWSRTPEQLANFDENEIKRYNVLQKSILSFVAPQLKKGGFLLYITCSVFKNENEDMADFIREKFNFRLEQMKLLKGYGKKADSMFVAGFQL